MHVEIPTKDVPKAKKFYGKLFGWKFRDFDPTYTLFDPGRKGVGGGIYKVGTIPTKSPVRAYVHVASVEKTLEQARSAGAKILQPKASVPGFGWYGAFRDPQGAEIRLWERSRKRRR